MKKFLGATFLAGTMLFNTATATPAQDKESIYQVALLQSLSMGYFDGSITVKELKTYGDTGIGTFDGLDGELILLDDVVYRANQDCKINVVDDTVTVPFSNVTFFEEDMGGVFYDFHSKSLLEESLNDTLRDVDRPNRFYMLKLEGDFNSITVRSEAKQSKPYPTLVEALEATQKEFTFKDIKGTLVGLYCPDFMSSLNSTGWHFHFISDDKTIGGYVLELDLKIGSFGLDKTDGFRVSLPSTDGFHALNFNQDLKEDIRKAEQDSVRR